MRIDLVIQAGPVIGNTILKKIVLKVILPIDTEPANGCPLLGDKLADHLSFVKRQQSFARRSAKQVAVIGHVEHRHEPDAPGVVRICIRFPNLRSRPGTRPNSQVLWITRVRS
jgi:hypothetical protein